eukprot:m.18901 g.18901  ORF g.18901 m.18901 type:complete len:383 (-) comp12120_c0_seq1:94-1242(-)
MSDQSGDAGYPPEGSKSVIVAYFLWLVGGWVGLHHFYLGRDNQGFLWLCTGGGFGIGWLRDSWRLPTYVQDANNSPIFLEKLETDVKYNKKPPWFMVFVGQLLFVGFARRTVVLALPHYEREELPFLPFFVVVLGSFACAVGAWLVGSSTRQTGSFVRTWIGAFVGELLALVILIGHNQRAKEDSDVKKEPVSDDLLPVFFTAICWVMTRRYRSAEPSKIRRSKRGWCRRFWTITFAYWLFLALCGSWFYFNCSVEQDGETVRIRDSIDNIFKSPAWAQLKVLMRQRFNTLYEKGFNAFWNEVLDDLDLRGEQRAYSTLGLQEDATEQEIKKAHRKLVLQYHPDKCQEAAEVCEAKFLEIQEAFETLTKKQKGRRTTRRRSE